MGRGGKVSPPNPLDEKGQNRELTDETAKCCVTHVNDGTTRGMVNVPIAAQMMPMRTLAWMFVAQVNSTMKGAYPSSERSGESNVITGVHSDKTRA